MDKRLYISYGTNINKKQMLGNCPTAKPMAVATLQGYQLIFQGRPGSAYVTIAPAKGQEVPVVVWEISAEDEKLLDIYEGARGGCYTKEYVEILVSGEMVKALVYIMKPAPYGIPTDMYLKTIADGYMEAGFPIKILNDALIRAYENTVTNEDAPNHENAVLRPAR